MHASEPDARRRAGSARRVFILLYWATEHHAGTCRHSTSRNGHRPQLDGPAGRAGTGNPIELLPGLLGAAAGAQMQAVLPDLRLLYVLLRLLLTPERR